MIRAIILALLLAGCANQPTLEDRANNAAIGDGVTTVVAVAAGAAELNPLGIGVIALKYPILEYAKTLPEGERETVQAAAAAMWSGATVNNVCVLGAMAICGPCGLIVCPLAGLGWGIGEWYATAPEREFMIACAKAKQRWAMTERCVWMEAKAE